MSHWTVDGDRTTTGAEPRNGGCQALNTGCVRAWQRDAYFLYYYACVGDGLLDAARRRV